MGVRRSQIASAKAGDPRRGRGPATGGPATATLLRCRGRDTWPRHIKAAAYQVAVPMSEGGQCAASHVAKLDDLPGPASGGPVDRLDPLWDSLGLPTEAYVFPYNVRVGSICSGMGTESWAFPHLPWKFQKVFWCEDVAAPRTFLLRNFGDDRIG